MVGLSQAESGLSGCYSHGYRLQEMGGVVLFVCLFLVLSHTAETGFDFSKKPRMISNFWSFCCHCPVLGFTNVSHSPWF